MNITHLVTFSGPLTDVVAVVRQSAAGQVYAMAVTVPSGPYTPEQLRLHAEALARLAAEAAASAARNAD